MKEERKRILKMVEEGKLPVDEALTLLEELEKAQKTMEEKQEQIVNELSTAVQFEEAKKEEPFQAKYQSTKDKIFDFVDSALKKIKDLDFDLNFGQSVDISHIFHQADVDLKDLDIDVANGSVKIAAWDQPDVRIECQAKVYRVDNQDQARQNFLRDVNFSADNRKLRFMTQQKWMKVEAIILVPRAQYERVRIRMFNGAVTGEEMDVHDLRVKTANGKISLNRLNGTKAEIETANGKINMTNSQFDDLEAETINGAIKLEGDFKQVETQSFNGNISCKLTGSRAELLQAKATTGGIDLLVPEGAPINGEFKTNLGGFNLNLVGVQVLEEKSEMIQKSLRFQSVNHPDKMVRIYADTKTGSISIQKSLEE
ncbi:DUF4097 family beta strand repeat-containing protein [Neobacillus vireti]|uniref:Adhesin domain-containing protein n=1 Tax=Neobacillus vireti LMG 21834 TaxID=1131730 RepID=A0AB94ILZ6_9BACI|nr:DUF4097 domain-containing protein [Neobacillus vireti]ETI68030.1 hypothetical protein BAVI_14684 [Neobacillus vireti LMG 21834]KLT18330.1 hypothetical protein AA980_08375 [Neobacillus vireti]